MAKQNSGGSFTKRLKLAWEKAKSGGLVKEALGAETEKKPKSK